MNNDPPEPTAMQNLFWKISAFVFFALCINACDRPQPKTKAQVMEARLEKRLQTWRKGQLDRCRREVLKAATAIVDSTLLTDARLNRDLSDLPFIPGRPRRPGFEAPEDTTPIAPLLQFLLLQDSLFLDSLLRDSFLMDSIRLDSLGFDSLQIDSIWRGTSN